MIYKGNTLRDCFKVFSILFIIILITVVYLHFSEQKTSVLFDGLFKNGAYFVDHKTKLFLTHSKYYHLKKSLNNLKPGVHIIHYDPSPVTRYYSIINVKKGKNFIKPVFKYYSLPSLSIFRSYKKNASNRIRSIKTFNYTTFTGHGIKKNNTLEIRLNQAISKNNNVYNYSFEWNVVFNNELISCKTLKRSGTDTSSKNSFKQVIFVHSTHRYYIECYYNEGVAKLKIWAEYI